jgi:hypothetical protein
VEGHSLPLNEKSEMINGKSSLLSAFLLRIHTKMSWQYQDMEGSNEET